MREKEKSKFVSLFFLGKEYNLSTETQTKNHVVVIDYDQRILKFRNNSVWNVLASEDLEGACTIENCHKDFSTA